MSNFKVTLTQAVPDTGLFTNADNSSGAAIGVGALMLLFAAIAIVWALVAKRRKHRNFQSSKFRLRMAKRTMLGLSVLTVIAGVFSLAISHQAKEINSASATDGTAGATSSTTSEETDALSIKVSDFELAVVPKEDGAFGYAYQTVTVGVPTNAGYTLSAYASSENLINSENKESVISGMEDSTEATILGKNTWGISFDKPEDATSKVWRRMPSTADTATVVDYIGSATKKDNESKIYYGVNVNTDLAYGDYTNTIVYTAVANILSINNINYMQDFAELSADDKELVLDSMQNGEQFQLTDIRDSKQYYIAKLADGNVWMTQNLDLDLDSTKTLTPADTDISANWAPGTTTIDFTGTTIESWEGSGTTPESADPGDVYYYTSGSAEDDTTYDSLASCMAANHTADECSHYHAGNYYNWSATVARNDTSNIGGEQDVSGSICPAGWRLPQGLSGENNISSLAEAYDITATNSLSLRGAPIYLTRSGIVDGEELSSPADQGYYWTSSPSGSTYAYGAMFSNGYYNPADSTYRTGGFSIRCILK